MANLEKIYDVVIIGAGPAGINAACEAHAAGLSSVIIEQKQILNTIHVYYPKTKRVDMDYKGVKAEFAGKVAFEKHSYSLDEYVQQVEGLLKEYKVDVRVPENIESISHSGEGAGQLFSVKTDKGLYRGRTCIIAIGMFAKPKRLEAEIDRDARKHILYEIAGKDFANQHIAVYGGANSAIEIALNFYKRGNDVTIIYRGIMDKLRSNLNSGNLEDMEAVLAEQSNPGLPYKFKINFQTQIAKATVEGGKLKAHYDTGKDELFDNCFVAIGGGSSRDFMEKAGVTFTEKGAPVLDDNFESATPGLYVVGDVSEKGKAAIVTAMKEAVYAMNRIQSRLKETAASR